MTKEALLELRKSMKLSQTQFARRIGCGICSLSAWENGKRKIPYYIAMACKAVEFGLKA